MANFAVIENGVVTNTIIADSKAIAEEITGATCVAYTTEPAEPGGTYVNKKFIKRQPFPSWVRDGESDWKAPVDAPAFDEENPKYYTWDEATTSWVETPTE
jgi:hypothetical protein